MASDTEVRACSDARTSCEEVRAPFLARGRLGPSDMALDRLLPKGSTYPPRPRLRLLGLRLSAWTAAFQASVLVSAATTPPTSWSPLTTRRHQVRSDALTASPRAPVPVCVHGEGIPSCGALHRSAEPHAAWTAPIAAEQQARRLECAAVAGGAQCPAVFPGSGLTHVRPSMCSGAERGAFVTRPSTYLPILLSHPLTFSLLDGHFPAVL